MMPKWTPKRINNWSEKLSRFGIRFFIQKIRKMSQTYIQIGAKSKHKQTRKVTVRKKRRRAIYRNETYGFQHFHKTKIRKTSMPIKSPLKCTWFRIPLLRMISTPKCFQNWSKTLPKSLKIRSKFLWKITHNLTGKSVTKLDTSQVFQSNTGWYQLLVFCLSAETQQTTFLFCSR